MALKQLYISSAWAVYLGKSQCFLAFCVVEEIYLVVTWGRAIFRIYYFLCYYLLLFCYD